MFSLAQATWSSLFTTPDRKILLLGLDSSGKSTLLHRLKLLFPATPPPSSPPPRFPTPTPTVGLNVAKLRVRTPHDRTVHSALVWDLGGAAPLRPIWDRYIADADAIVWVVDARCEGRLKEGRGVVEAVLGREDVEGKPLLVWANKYDGDGDGVCVDPLRVSAMVPRRMDDERDVLIMPCSAVTGVGVRAGMEWLVARAARRAERLDAARDNG